jgi:hypothetical protein
MADAHKETVYEVVLWDYDAAPDAMEYLEPYDPENIRPYYVWKRLRFSRLDQAKSVAYWQVKEFPFAIGAAVFHNGQFVFGAGLTFDYPK